MQEYDVVNANSPDQASTLEDFITLGKSGANITYYNYSVLQVENTTDGKMQIQFVQDNIVNDYMEILQDNAVKVELNQDEQNKYYYNPDLLSYDIYGSTELDFIILKLNGIIDPKDFDLPKIKLIQADTLIELLSDIYNAESKHLLTNRRLYNLSSPID